MKTIILSLFIACTSGMYAQLPDSCKLNIGTNLGGLADYGTEIPFVDVMKNCREWYSKDFDGNGDFDTQVADSMQYRADGYPTYLPQTITGRAVPQIVSTIWANTDGWTSGKYVVLFDGVGSISIRGGVDSVVQTSGNRFTFYPVISGGNYIEMLLNSSSITNPVRNIRVLMPGSELTYTTQPFNPIWLDKARIFKSFRFMDWGHTNGWGQADEYSWEDTTLFNWQDRQQLDYYTWTNAKGVPYERMIQLMNTYDIDGWVCVPHRASNDYIDGMATLFHTQLEPERLLTVEYSNEIWNWMFGQTNWCYTYGTLNTGLPWPECTVPYVQNCLNRWTTVYGTDIGRIKRAVGLQTGWLDVSQRIVYTMNPSSFDVICPTYYFGLDEVADAVLDSLGTSATTDDIAYWARKNRNTNEKVWLNGIKTTIADSLQKEMYFYEGGQHLTPTPFGTMPTYADALLNIQRDTAMYHLYDEWFAYLRTLQTGDKPMQLMNFSLISQRSAQYGSWGILETMDQDTNTIKAPKYAATLHNMLQSGCSNTTSSIQENTPQNNIQIYPNPFENNITVESSDLAIHKIEIFDTRGVLIKQLHVFKKNTVIDVSDFMHGVYIIKMHTTDKKQQIRKIVK